MIPQASDIAAKASERAFGQPLVVNVMRGLVAEAVVACALRTEWRWCSEDYNAWDFKHEATGTCLEVKQSARRQSWKSDGVKRPGAAKFDIAARSGRLDGIAWIEGRRRWADIYIFAHHDVADDSANHCDPSQWTFYVVASSALPAAASIGLGPIRKLASKRSFVQLSEAVAEMLSQVSKNHARSSS